MALQLDSIILEPVGPGQTTLRLRLPDQQTLCSYIASNNVAVVLEITQGPDRERVRAYRCDDNGVHVERGYDDTRARAWQAAACVCAVDELPLCPGVDPECDTCNPPNPWDMVSVGPGLDLDRTDPQAPHLDVSRTNVAGTYGGARVDQYGRFTYIPPNWPASALPVFDPCLCPDGGDGGQVPPSVTAGDVAYSPCGHVSGTTVQDALCQLEQWASGLTISTGVMSVNAGDGIDISGPTSSPTISLEPVTITPGTYAGFTINQFGQVVGYTPTTVDHPQHVAVSPLGVSYDAGTNTWTHTVDWADYVQPGVVQFVDLVDIQNNTVPTPQQEWAINYEGAEALVQRELAALGIGNFEINLLPVASGVTGTDDLAVYNYTSGQHERISIDNLADLVGAAIVMLEYDPASSTTGASAGISSVTTTAIGVHVVTLAEPLVAPVLHAMIRGDNPLTKITVEVSTATTVTVRTYDLAVVGGTLQATPADYPFYLSIHEDV